MKKLVTLYTQTHTMDKKFVLFFCIGPKSFTRLGITHTYTCMHAHVCFEHLCNFSNIWSWVNAAKAMDKICSMFNVVFHRSTFQLVWRQYQRIRISEESLLSCVATFFKLYKNFWMVSRFMYSFPLLIMNRLHLVRSKLIVLA